MRRLTDYINLYMKQGCFYSPKDTRAMYMMSQAGYNCVESDIHKGVMFCPMLEYIKDKQGLKVG